MPENKTVFSMIGDFVKAGLQALNDMVEISQQATNGWVFVYRAFSKLSLTEDFGAALDYIDEMEAEIEQLKDNGTLAANFEMPYDFVDLGAYMHDWKLAQTEFAELASRYFPIAYPQHLLSRDL